MTNVWYVSGWGKRIISSADWARLGVNGVTSNEWSYVNGWAVDESTLTGPQLAILDNYQDFVLGQTGPRAQPAPISRQDLVQSNYAYYIATKELYDAFVASSSGITEEEVQELIDASVVALINGAPGTRDTLKELSDILTSDENTVTALITSVADKYVKPGGGIPSSDLTSAVQTSLGKADTALQSYTPADGSIAKAKLVTGVQTSLGLADTAKQADGAFGPAQYELDGWTYDPSACFQGGGGISGYMFVTGFVATKTSIANIYYEVWAAATSLNAGQNFIGLYEGFGSKNRLYASADQSSIWTSTGAKALAITPQTLTVGNTYYLGFLTNGSGVPAFSSSVGAPYGASAVKVLSSLMYRFGYDSSHTAITALPSTLGTITSGGAQIWAGFKS